MRELRRTAPAKINLTLRVGGLRPDGFHEIESLVARVGLCDVVSVTPRDDRELSLTCDDPSIPCDDGNLALRAARRLAETARVRDCGVHITLQKRIPAGAGLGGGSSNAATTLMLLNDLWKLRQTRAQLAAIGADIGSDVPLFFHTPLCIVRGRGEQVEDLRLPLSGWAALILSGHPSATHEVYAAWDRTKTRCIRPSIDQVLRHADRTETLMPHLFNDLEGPAFAVNLQLGELSERLSELAGDPLRMTGSGSAFFRLFDQEEPASVFAQRVADRLGVPAKVGCLESG